MSEPVVVVATVRPRPGRLEEVVAILREVVGAVHEEPGCLLYSVNVGDDGSVVFVEKWASREDADRHGRESAVLPVLAERATPLLSGPPELVVLSPRPAGDPAKGAV